MASLRNRWAGDIVAVAAALLTTREMMMVVMMMMVMIMITREAEEIEAAQCAIATRELFIHAVVMVLGVVRLVWLRVSCVKWNREQEPKRCFSEGSKIVRATWREGQEPRLVFRLSSGAFRAP